MNWTSRYADQLRYGRLRRISRLMDLLRTGDTLVIWRLDWLGHLLKNLIELVEPLRGRMLAAGLPISF